MPWHDQKDLKGAFEPVKKNDEPARAAVPESIAKHKPAPALRPGGSWRAQADHVDRSIKEQEEAQRTRNKWSKELNDSLRYGKGFNREA